MQWEREGKFGARSKSSYYYWHRIGYERRALALCRLDPIRGHSRRCGRFLHVRGVPEHQGRVLERVGEPRASPRRGYARLLRPCRCNRVDVLLRDKRFVLLLYLASIPKFPSIQSLKRLMKRKGKRNTFLTQFCNSSERPLCIWVSMLITDCNCERELNDPKRNLFTQSFHVREIF